MEGLPESHADLLQAEFATLATTTADGTPNQTEVWFLYEDGQLKLSLNDTRVKTKHLRLRPKCSLLILDLKNPYRYVDIRGVARIEDDAGHSFADRVGAKYSSDLGEDDGPGEGRVVVTIEPRKVFAVDMSAG